MHKRTIYYSIGFAALLVVALGTLNFNTDTSLLRGTVDLGSMARATSAEISEDVVLCDVENNILMKLPRGVDTSLNSGTDLRFDGFQYSPDVQDSEVIESILISFNDNLYSFNIEDSFTGLVNMGSVIGDNISESVGYVSFNQNVGNSEISFHFRYLDENQVVLEINPVASCTPANTALVMIPCEDCKIRTSLSQRDLWLMLNHDYLKVSSNNFSGSKTDDGNGEGIELDLFQITNEFSEIYNQDDVSIEIASYDSERLDRQFVYLQSFSNIEAFLEASQDFLTVVDEVQESESEEDESLSEE